MIEKPNYGSPCNRCGKCCIAEQCPISVMIFGARDLCPALDHAGDAFSCGLISRPDDFAVPGHGPEVAQKVGDLLGVGTFCDAIWSEADFAIAEARGEL